MQFKINYTACIVTYYAKSYTTYATYHTVYKNIKTQYKTHYNDLFATNYSTYHANLCLMQLETNYACPKDPKNYKPKP